jgi:phosphoesterase RecJ-like protein
MFTREEIDEVIAAIGEHKDVLCVSHVGPDGDAVGSLLGMGWMLKAMGRQPTLALQDRVPDNLAMLPGAAEVVGTDAIRDDYELIICLDASSEDRMGNIYRQDAHGQIPLLVIDHHVTNTQFGDVNWVAPQCAATCQMLVYLADALSVPLTEKLAECLLTGVVTDTLCFRTSNADADVLESAMRLMRGGASLADITAQTLNRRPFSLVTLWGTVLADVHLADGVIWATVSQAQFAESGYDSDSELSLSSLLVATIEADMSATFAEKADDQGATVVECSFRAKPGFDVATLAFELGGGGHPPASGCTLPGALDEVSQQVVGLLQEERRRQLAEPRRRMPE